MATRKPTGRASCNDALLEEGFVYDPDKTTAVIESSVDMQRGGPYDVLGCYRKGQVTVTVEQNTDTRVEAGMTQATTYPEVVVVEGPNGRVACPADDLNLILAMAEAVG